ncbi:hypothetical protein [Enterococcus sp.]|uniref:hypothetical protein n=1 Tax=Enterococcus sp. TaxID=35783 RepID=UPI002898C279|nr:hypothetical protein [Enterococcus sp.]
MGFGFLDAISYLAIQETRDLKREKKHEYKTKIEQEQKCYKAISDASSNLFNVIIGVFDQTSGPSPDIVQNCMALPYHAFLSVLQVQTIPITAQQSKLLDIFFKTINSASVSKNEFYEAIHSSTKASDDIEATIGISMNHIGLFWKHFFQAVYLTSNDSKPLKKVIEYYHILVRNFSAIGDQKSTLADQICEDFSESLLYQFEEYRNTPASNADSMYEPPFIEHLNRMKEIAVSLKEAVFALDGEGPDMDTLFQFFVYGILYDLVSMSHCEDSEKGEILNRAFELSNINGEFSGYDIIENIEKGTDASELVIFCTSTEGENYGLWGLLILISNRTNRDDDSLNFVKECVAFLEGIEYSLKTEYPNAGFGDFARQYMEYKTTKIVEHYFRE